MASAIDGFSDLAVELKNISDRVVSKETKKKALEAGANPIVERARRIIAQHSRTGRLESGIIAKYDASDDTMGIGWTEDAFYGRILDNGFNHTGGKRVQIEHLKSTYEAEKEKVLNNMLSIYNNALK